MKKRLLLFLCLTLSFLIVACQSGSKSVSRYEQALKCEGRYVQRDDDSSDTYGATLSFYEKDGKVYANIEYTNYMGTIDDGVVEDSTDPDYTFEIHPKGKFGDGESDFTFLFDEEKMYIAWGSSEYTLTKSDGSPEDEEDQRTPFDETDVYQIILDELDENYETTPHKCVFDRETKTLFIYFEAMSGLRSKFATNYSDLSESWEKVVDSFTELSSSIFDVVTGGVGYKDVYAVSIYWVDELKDSNDYADSEIVLHIKNGKVFYDLANEYKYGSSSSGNSSAGNSKSSSSSGSYNSKSGSSSSYSSSSATMGEKNALQKAHDYLDFMAFSYSGLYDQLKYEGYSDSEAKYAVDNCGADWYEQAAKKAQEYLDYSSFSQSELQDQLEYEGFTSEQASYGVNKVYR